MNFKTMRDFSWDEVVSRDRSRRSNRSRRAHRQLYQMMIRNVRRSNDRTLRQLVKRGDYETVLRL